MWFHLAFLGAVIATVALATDDVPEPHIRCSDSKSYCPHGTTCCELKTGGIGCCPLPKATCCEDDVHCCPVGYDCNISEGTCGKKGLPSFAIVVKMDPFVANTDCADGRHFCKDVDATCCKAGSDYYCCGAGKNATCCTNGNKMLGCCGKGFKCNDDSGFCDHQTSIFRSKQNEMLKAKHIAVTAVMCDSSHYCSDGHTCCGYNNVWYCCPIEDTHANCCSDEKHCCPDGYRCNLTKMTCDRIGGNASIKLLKKVLAKRI